jgi:hypothetical protein
VSNWVTIYSSTNANQSEIVKSVLKDNGIEVVVVDKMDSMHIHLMNAGVELHVSPEDVVKAKHLITKHSL